MLKLISAIVLSLTLLPSCLLGDDLLKVFVGSHSDAEQLQSLSGDPLISLTDGYLILADPVVFDKITASTLRWELIASNVARDQLALDGRRDRLNADRYEPVFEQHGLRLFHRDQVDTKTAIADQLFGLGSFSPAVRYVEPSRLAAPTSYAMDDLATLIATVDTDSLESFVRQLQAFDGREAGTASNIDSRDWIYDKFAAFGYDSLFLDPFPQLINGSSTMYNVVATKPGTRYPDVHVVVGAHHDAVAGSPGADDNGSGTAGVLELARLLRNVDTDLTFVFATFDAEEYGLHGSWHYADRAVVEGEEIVFMLNMDMIANLGNVNQAALYYGADQSYAELWQHLADSLLGLEGVLSGGSGGSDHYPFSQHGFPVTFVAEQLFSGVYHSYQDSTSYMDFAYMTKLVQVSLATAYVAGMPQPLLVFGYPGERPEWLDPHQATTFQVQATPLWDGVPAPGTGELHYSVNGAPFVAVAMTELGGNLYEATIPALGCVELIEYYVSLEEAGGQIFLDPDPSKPREAVVATETSVVLHDNFEFPQGWSVSGSVTEGAWERAVPSANGGSRGDPPTDYDGSGRCFVTDNSSNADIDDGTTILTSPILDLSLEMARISYARWYSNDQGNAPGSDVMEVFVSNGGNWELVEMVGPVDEAGGGWIMHNFLVQDFVTPTATVQVRFEASDLGSGSIVETGIDAFVATAYQCIHNLLTITTPSLADGAIGQPYAQQLEAANGIGDLVWIDKYGDLDGTGLALSTTGLVSGSPVASGTINITAEVNDNIGIPYQAPYGINITTCCIGRVGDANGLGGDEPTIGDVSTLIDMLFISGLPDLVACMHEADVNMSGGSALTKDDITISDVSTLIDYLFITGSSLGLPGCL